MKTRRPAVKEDGSILFLVLLITVEDVLNRRPEILLVLRRGNFQQRLINTFITREFFITQQYFQWSSFETDAKLLTEGHTITQTQFHSRKLRRPVQKSTDTTINLKYAHSE